MSLSQTPSRPDPDLASRVLRVVLEAEGVAEAHLAPWEPAEHGRARLARAGGTALAAALLAAQPTDAAQPLVLAVGDAVRRGVPTAARLTVASRSPASGLYADGQLGGSLARRLSGFADALVIGGRTNARGAVLVVDERADVRLECDASLVGRSPRETADALRARHHDAAILCCGPAGEAEVEFASLFSGDDPPSSVGRGGLGAVLGRLGLKAVVVRAPQPSAGASADELRARLVASPRLLARVEGGTFELIESEAARRELRALGGAAATTSEAHALRAGANEGRTGQHGCAGCPTPCGWVFERPGGGRRGGRYSAVEALGPRLGLTDFDAVLRLLDTCDHVGVDAKEAGESLALLADARADGRLAGPRLFGDAQALEQCIAQLATKDGPLVGGALGVARAAGAESAVRRARGQAVRVRRSHAALLGQCVSPRGADPMRAFPFLAEEGAPLVDAARLGLRFPLPPGATDPEVVAGKGRLVWWHENLSAALDATGFCAFSAGALLADGGASATELADWLLPDAWRGEGDAADALQSLGAGTVLLQRELNRRWGEADGADAPPWAKDRLEQPSLLGEYRRLRGVDADGRLHATARALIGSPQLASWCVEELGDDVESAAPAEGRSSQPPAASPVAGPLDLRAAGALGRLLRELPAEWPLPLTVAELRAELRRRDPAAERWIGAEGAPLATIWRDGVRLPEDARLEAGDALELVVAISGG